MRSEDRKYMPTVFAYVVAGIKTEPGALSEQPALNQTETADIRNNHLVFASETELLKQIMHQIFCIKIIQQ